MKKLLSILTVSAFITSSATNTIACLDNLTPVEYRKLLIK